MRPNFFPEEKSQDKLEEYICTHVKDHRLDLKDCPVAIDIPFGYSITENPLVRALSNYCQHVTEVDLTNCNIKNGLSFSRFRKHLPHLRHIILTKSELDASINGRQFAKYLAKGIYITADNAIDQHITSLLKSYLLSLGCSSHASALSWEGISNRILNPNIFRQAYECEDAMLKARFDYWESQPSSLWYSQPAPDNDAISSDNDIKIDQQTNRCVIL